MHEGKNHDVQLFVFGWWVRFSEIYLIQFEVAGRKSCFCLVILTLSKDLVDTKLAVEDFGNNRRRAEKQDEFPANPRNPT